jgi:hypothetical protein
MDLPLKFPIFWTKFFELLIAIACIRGIFFLKKPSKGPRQSFYNVLHIHVYYAPNLVDI